MSSDNYSRYVLDRKVYADISAVNTRDLLLSALAKAKILGGVSKPEVYSNGGRENDNAAAAGLGALGSAHPSESDKVVGGVYAFADSIHN